MAPTVRDVLYLYRAAYERFVDICGNPEQARNAVALLDQGTVSAIHHVPRLNPSAVKTVSAEANNILTCLRQQDPVLPAIPLITALCEEEGHIDPRIMAFHQDLVVRGVAEFLDGVGKLIFDDRCTCTCSDTGLVGNSPELRRHATAPSPCPKGCPSTGKRHIRILEAQVRGARTFSWRRRTSGGPMYGRIIFTSEAFVTLVLNGELLVKIAIGHRQIWLRKYVPRKVNI